MYAITRSRLLEVASGLDDEVAANAVAALPGWTVKDAYAHLAGVCADVLAGNTAGGGTPAWTAKQVDDRAGLGLSDICDEWSRRSHDIDEWLRAAGRRGSFLGFDIWTHEQDIRSAVGLRGSRDDERVRFLAGAAVEVFDGRMKEAGAPPARVITETMDRVLGGEDSGATLRCTDYELLRTVFGRRSRAQIEGADWEGDPGPRIDHLHLFDLPSADLVD